MFPFDPTFKRSFMVGRQKEFWSVGEVPAEDHDDLPLCAAMPAMWRHTVTLYLGKVLMG